MQYRINVITFVITLLFLGNVVLADYVCEPAPISLTTSVQSQYPYNQPIAVTVTTGGLPEGYTVMGQVKDESGNLVQQLTAQVILSKASFSFMAIQVPGIYKFQALVTRPVPPSDTISSDIKSFIIKAPLSLELTVVGGAVQYTTTDLELRAIIKTPSGTTIESNKIVTAKVDGVSISINPSFTDQGSGQWQIIIPKEQLSPGRMDVTLNVVDFQNKYEPVTKYLTGISVVRPEVAVSVDVPVTTKVNDVITIKVSTKDNTGKPMDVDSLTLTCTYPGGTNTKRWQKSALQNDFSNPSTGIYEVQFQLVVKEGGAYRFKASAIEQGYGTGASPEVISVATGGGIISTCDTSDQCDPSCPDDPDCNEAGFPWLVVFIIVIVLAIVVFAIRRR